MNREEALRFRTFGFLHCRQMLSPREIDALSAAFDLAMAKAERHRPTPSGERQQVVPFFDYDPDAFYPLLDDQRLVGVFDTLLGEDFILTATEGISHVGGSPWHRDACAPEGMFSMRAAIYLDPLGPDDGCLSVIPGSHFTPFREALETSVEELGLPPEELPGRYPLVNEPGDVIFMNHKTFHAALGDRPGRRAIHINAVQNAVPDREDHVEWLTGFLGRETEAWGRLYSERLVVTAPPRRQRMLARAIELGFGTTGRITHLQDLR